MVRLMKRTATIGTILFVLLIVLAYTSFRLGNTGISIEQIVLTTSDGVQLNARVYKPTMSSGRLPAIVVCHGLMASLTMMQSGYSLEFAKRGFLVVAIDLRGHGGSGGSIAMEVLFGLMEQGVSIFSFMPRPSHNQSISDSHQEQALRSDVEAAVNYLIGRPDVQINKIALLGHSLGGLAVIAEASSDPRIGATVGIAPAISSGSNITINLTTPRNLLLAVGVKDNVIGEKQVSEFYMKATDGAGGVGTLSGSFLDGSAREMVISSISDHVGEMFDNYIIEEAITWVEKSLAIRNSEPVTISTWPDIVLPFSIVASLLSIFPAVLFAENLDQFIVKKKPVQKPKATGMRGRKLLLIYLVGWGCSVSSFLIGIRVFGWIPLFLGDMIVAAYVIAPTVLSLVALIYMKKKNKLNWDPVKPNHAALKSFLIGVLSFLVVYVGLNMAVSWNFIDLFLTSRRLLWATIIFAILLPFTCIDEIWIRNLQTKLTLKSHLRIGIVVFISLLIKLFAIAFLANLFGAFIFLVAALFMIPSFFSAWLFEKTGSVFGGAVFNSLFMAWIITTILPFTIHSIHL